MLDYVRGNRRLWVTGTGLVFICIFALIWGLAIRTPAYSFYLDGNKQFIVENRDCFNEVLEKISLEQEKEYQIVPHPSSDIKLKLVFAKRQDITAAADVENELREALNIKIHAIAIVINGQNVGYLRNLEEAQRTLELLKKDFTKVDQGEQIVDLKYQEDVQLKEEAAPGEQVLTEKQAYELLSTGSKNPQKHIVQEGDSLWSIARRNNMLVNDIIQANQLSNDRLTPGQKLIVGKYTPYITVIAQIQGEKDEEIPYETEVVTDPGARSVTVKQEGQTGQKHLVYTATMINGVIDNMAIKEEKILKQAVNKILVKGSHVQVASRGGTRSVSSSGVLDWPVSGSITQYFGKNGHTGLDIAASRGYSIKAAASGQIIFAGRQGNYGNFVIIDHGNGIVTRYAHCDNIKASTGQKVVKGDTIATVGSTGKSTGPHLHFEVQSGGSFGNPLQFLN